MKGKSLPTILVSVVHCILLTVSLSFSKDTIAQQYPL